MKKTGCWLGAVRFARTLAGWLGSGGVLLAACGPEQPATWVAPPSSTESTASASLPPSQVAAPKWETAPLTRPGTLAPSLAVFGDQWSAEQLGAVERCQECHPERVAEWQDSAHAFSSFNNPIYRTAVSHLRAEVGHTTSRFCAGCHDPVLLVDGAMDAPIEPTQAGAYRGITCLVCHRTEANTLDGNGSYQIGDPEAILPSLDDSSSVAQHRRAMRTPALATSEFCASCHRSFLGAEVGNPDHLNGIDDYGGWARSLYAGSRTGQLDEPLVGATCQTCHMPQVRSRRGVLAGRDVASHAFLGGHTWLARLRDRPEREQRVREQLQSSVRLDIGRVDVGARTYLAPDIVAGPLIGPIVLSVVLRNTGVGHHFPGGTRDIQDTWLAVTVADRHGSVLAESGNRLPSSGFEGALDDSVHRLLTLQVGEGGHPVLAHQTHAFRGPGFDTTLPPRAARVVRYSFTVPESLSAEQLPLRAHVELLHRSRSVGMQEATCRESRTPTGQTFHRTARDLGLGVADPCLPQPLTRVASARLVLGAASTSARAPEGAAISRSARSYDYLLGMLSDLPERLDLLRPLMVQVLEELPGDAERAPFLLLLARLDAQQGRVDSALELLDELERRLSHPAISRVRGDALAKVWRWKEAVEAYRDTARRAPKDDQAWANLAQALGSTGAASDALLAAQRGLVWQPRGEQLLRTQALSLQRLGVPEAIATGAHRDYLVFRPSDAIPHVRKSCIDRHASCAIEQLGVHTHPLEEPTPQR